VTDPRPDPGSERAGESEYGNDTGFAEPATGQPGSPGPDAPATDAPDAPGEPPD